MLWNFLVGRWLIIKQLLHGATEITASLWCWKLRVKLAPPQGGILWDRYPQQSGSAVYTLGFHQPPAPVFQPMTLAARSSSALSAALACAWLVSSSLAIRRACYGSSCFSRAVPCAAQHRGCLPGWGNPCNWLRWSLWERRLVFKCSQLEQTSLPCKVLPLCTPACPASHPAPRCMCSQAPGSRRRKSHLASTKLIPRLELGELLEQRMALLGSTWTRKFASTVGVLSLLLPSSLAYQQQVSKGAELICVP